MSRTLAGAAQFAPENPRLRNQSENHAKWQLQLNGFDAKFLRENSLL